MSTRKYAHSSVAHCSCREARQKPALCRLATSESLQRYSSACWAGMHGRGLSLHGYCGLGLCRAVYRCCWVTEHSLYNSMNRHQPGICYLRCGIVTYNYLLLLQSVGAKSKGRVKGTDSRAKRAFDLRCTAQTAHPAPKCRGGVVHQPARDVQLLAVLETRAPVPRGDREEKRHRGDSREGTGSSDQRDVAAIRR